MFLVNERPQVKAEIPYIRATLESTAKGARCRYVRYRIQAGDESLFNTHSITLRIHTHMYTPEYNATPIKAASSID